MAMIITISSANQIAADAASKTPKLSKTKVSININAVRKLQVKNKPSGARVKWKSANKKIATVSSKGVVKGINAGKTKVTCAIKKDKESYKLSAQITVNRLDAIATISTTSQAITGNGHRSEAVQTMSCAAAGIT